MRICYVDESGDTGSLSSAASNVQPVFVIAGVDLPQNCIHQLTQDFLFLKERFFPRLLPKDSVYLDWIKTEIKGSDIRKQAIDPSHRKRTHAIGFLDKVMDLLEANGARLHGRVWVKAIGAPINHRSIYTYSVQYICENFNHCLGADSQTGGIVVCDSRSNALNTQVSYSTFTQKFKTSGDAYPNLIEMPVFGHSVNHAGVQIADLICSALLFPLAVHAYCRGHLTGIHVRDYTGLRDRFAGRLARMQKRYPHPHPAPGRGGRSQITGGIVVDEKLGHQGRDVMFRAGKK